MKPTSKPLPALADMEHEVVAESREWGRQRLEERLQFAANRAGRDRAIDLQGHRQRGAGMRFEEYLQNDRTSRGRLVDSFLCGITRQDWQRG